MRTRDAKRPTRRANPKEKCRFCSVILGKTSRRTYCDACVKSKKVQRFLNAMYCRRAYRKRTGKTINTTYEMLYKYV